MQAVTGHDHCDICRAEFCVRDEHRCNICGVKEGPEADGMLMWAHIRLLQLVAFRPRVRATSEAAK